MYKPLFKYKRYFLVLFIIISAATLYQQENSKANFNPETFIPDSTYRTFFPWDEVQACLNDKLDASDFKGRKICPKCGMASEDLYWINYKSPQWTWYELCGRAGPMSICPKCKIQVEFILHMMS